MKFVVAYDGSGFCGFAPQRGQRTVHGTLTDGIRQVSGEENEIIGASRTDSGASAKGQVVHFDTANPMPVERWANVVNQVLPSDLTVVSVAEVHPEFHSRFWAVDRYYRYRIMTGARDPMRTRYAWHYGKGLDAERMHEAAQRLIGTHSFLAFSQLLEPWKSPVRTLHRLNVRQVRDEVWIDVVGLAFVRGMMRRISGALWEIGRGKYEAEHLDSLLAATDKKKIVWPPVLPACGLTLMRVRYGRHPSPQQFFNATDALAESQNQTKTGQTE